MKSKKKNYYSSFFKSSSFSFSFSIILIKYCKRINNRNDKINNPIPNLLSIKGRKNIKIDVANNPKNEKYVILLLKKKY